MGGVQHVVSAAMESPNHYELLCVTPEATADEIRAAYRRLIRVYHPDVASPAGGAMTLRLNNAQRELLDPRLRARYDSDLRAGTMPYARVPDARVPNGKPQQRDAGSSSYRQQTDMGWSASAARSKSRRAEVSWHPGLFGFWLATMLASICAGLIATAVVFAFSYSGPLTFTTERLIPPIVIAIAWLVGGASKPPKLLIALMVIGAALWPLTAAGVEPFTIFASLPAGVLPSLTIIACAVVALRISARRANALSRSRPLHHTSAA
jgi:hypothetical protein